MTVRQISYASFPAARRGGVSFPRAALTTAGAFAKDFGIVLSVIAVYFLLRGAAPDRYGYSVDVTRHLVSFERTAGVFWEPQIQEWSIHFGAVKECANFVYAYMHFPVLIIVGAWLWSRDREAFRFMRNVMFISMVIGLFFYWLVPAAPPRLMAAHGYNLGFVDTVFGGDTHVNYAQPSLILNEYAAIPSFHFGWIAMASAAIWVNTRSRTLRSMAVTLTVVMTWAIVASANHLFFDMALGGLVIVISWQLATRFQRSRADGREPIEMGARTELEAAA
ncbi:MAG: phosphatase PAP2 family protein [Dehalococcoidia bacterium]